MVKKRIGQKVNAKGPHNIYELYGTGVTVKRSSEKYMSHIYCIRKIHGPVQSNKKTVIVPYKYYHRHARLSSY